MRAAAVAAVAVLAVAAPARAHTPSDGYVELEPRALAQVQRVTAGRDLTATRTALARAFTTL